MKKMQCCSPTFASVATVIGRVEDYFLQAHHHGCRGQDLLVCAEGEKVVHVDSEGIVWCRIHAQLDHLSDDVPYVHFCWPTMMMVMSLSWQAMPSHPWRSYQSERWNTSDQITSKSLIHCSYHIVFQEDLKQ